MTVALLLLPPLLWLVVVLAIAARIGGMWRAEMDIDAWNETRKGDQHGC